MAEAIEVEVPWEESPEFFGVLQRCNTDDPKAEDVQALKKWLEKKPDLWRICGDMSWAAAMRMIETIRASPAIKESLKAGRLAMCKDLGYDAASPLERMLIEHAVVCWMRLQVTEDGYSNMLSQDRTLVALGDYWDRHLSAAQRRYLRAVETLVRIRRLALPAVQINVADKQVNVVG